MSTSSPSPAFFGGGRNSQTIIRRVGVADGTDLLDLFGAPAAGDGATPENVARSKMPAQNELIREIVDAIEDRVIAELERRGLRHHPGVF